MRVAGDLVLDEQNIEEKFIRASGPGGQNVNKVATAVELRFDVNNCSALTPPERKRLLQLAGWRASQDGIVIIRAERFRSQDRNRADARRRLIELVMRARQKPKRRIKTKPSRAAKARRLESKTRRGRVKQLRSSNIDFE